MIRFLDLLLSLVFILISLPLLLLILVFGYFDTGSPLFFQQRVGKNKVAFTLVKFRTMYPDTPDVASHLNSKSSVTKLGHILRRTKLDELPQLYNVLVGDMTLVGPRPCLFNQSELINFREEFRIFDFKPGITGLSQIKKIDMSTPEILAKTDSEMIRNFNVYKYFYYIFATVFGRGYGDAIK